MFEKLKNRIHRLYKQKQKPIVVALALLLLSSIAYAVAKTYWQRNITLDINVIGIEASLLVWNGPVPNGYDNYKNHVLATQLDSNQQIVLTIDSENYANNIWLSSSVIGAPTGLTWAFTGQYWTCYDSGQYSQGDVSHIDPVGSTFDLTGSHVIDKTQMIYHPCVVGGTHGGLMLISFSWDGGSAQPGTYSLNLEFQMGFV